MIIKNEIKKILVVLVAVAILLGGLPTGAYAAEKNVDVEKQNGNSKYSKQMGNTKKEYAKWKIKKVDGSYFYRQKAVRLLLDDTGKKTVTNKFFYNKNGTVDIKIIRNKKGRIKKVKYISEKRAKEIIKNCNTAYII